MTKTLLVDAGGVLFNNITEDTDFLDVLSDRHGVDTCLLRSCLDEQDVAYETGCRHVHDVLRSCLLRSGCDGTADWDPGDADRLYLERVRPHTDVFSRLREIRRRTPDLRIALANNEAEHWDMLKNREYNHFGLVDDVVSSWVLGAVKPEEHYFSELLRTLAVPASDVVLVDDNAEVVAATERVGLKAVVFTGPDALDEALDLLLTPSVT